MAEAVALSPTTTTTTKPTSTRSTTGATLHGVHNRGGEAKPRETSGHSFTLESTAVSDDDALSCLKHTCFKDLSKLLFAAVPSTLGPLAPLLSCAL